MTVKCVNNHGWVHNCYDCGAVLVRFFPDATPESAVRTEGPVFGGYGFYKCSADCPPKGFGSSEPILSEQDLVEARRLFEAGWLPISNKYRSAGCVPVPACEEIPALLKKVSPHVNPAHWKVNSDSIADLRTNLARGGPSKELPTGVYIALKKLCGPYNRGPK